MGTRGVTAMRVQERILSERLLLVSTALLAVSLLLWGGWREDPASAVVPVPTPLVTRPAPSTAPIEPLPAVSTVTPDQARPPGQPTHGHRQGGR